jgi:Putative regulator of cell autolysis
MKNGEDYKAALPPFLFDSKYRIHRHLLLQAFIIIIVIGNFFDAPDRVNLTLDRFYSAIGYFLFLNMLVYFNAYVLFPRFLAKNKPVSYLVSLVIFSFIALFLMIIIQFYFYDIAVIHQEPSGPAIFLSMASSLLGIALFQGGVATFLLFKQWVAGSQRMNDLRIATSRSELDFLKSQINPHFLFNMINNANILVEEDPETASYILIKLDDLLRYQLNDSLRDKVRLQADIDFLTNFLRLEKIRRDKFDFEIDIKGEIGEVQVAPLLFIPFVENAVKHNASGDENSFVCISFALHQNNLSFSCRNSVGSRSVKRESGGLGLVNIKRRLDLLFEDNYSLNRIQTDTVYTIELELKL